MTKILPLLPKAEREEPAACGQRSPRHIHRETEGFGCRPPTAPRRKPMNHRGGCGQLEKETELCFQTRGHGQGAQPQPGTGTGDGDHPVLELQSPHHSTQPPETPRSPSAKFKE